MMSYRRLEVISVLTGVVAAVSLAAVAVAGQGQPAVAETGTPLRTPWGDPDLQGVWTNHTLTPFDTIHDPDSFTKPWTVSLPMTNKGSPAHVMEYACHEGNLAPELFLGAARAREKEATEGAAKSRR
jgi:hypothetical protein